MIFSLLQFLSVISQKTDYQPFKKRIYYETTVKFLAKYKYLFLTHVTVPIQHYYNVVLSKGERQADLKIFLLFESSFLNHLWKTEQTTNLLVIKATLWVSCGSGVLFPIYICFLFYSPSHSPTPSATGRWTTEFLKIDVLWPKTCKTITV